jgi:signal transduction histidine kinase/CheY-like chemotaxis protein
VRCGTLERVAAAGAVSLDEFYVFPLNAEEGALLCSTPLYPEWVLCRLAGISDALAKDILAALWAVGHDEVLAKSSGVGEWSLPLDYHSVRVCLREMRLGPYKTYMRRMTPLDRMFWSWYWRWILAAFLALGGLLIVVIIILRLNRRLVVARNNAQSADRAKSEFLANMSHEIRTPLNAVLGLSDLMMETELTELQSDYVKTIYSSSEALFAIINNILDISKIDADKLELECVEFDMRHCLESSLNVVAAGAQLKGLAMVCDIDSKLPVQVWGDFSRLRQVLLNLLSNAVKFTERGHVMLQAEAVAGEGGASLFKICISDTGIGMSAEQIKRIFAPFSQADSSTTRRYGGTGLGLSISKKIIDLMGGRIVVRSEEGRGSCFELLIPLELGKTVESVFLQEKVECLQGLRVLLVDHYKPRALVVDKQLQFWGLATARVDNHREALAILESGEQFDLIILDSTVAERCGEEKCSYLKEAADALGAKVILMVFKDVVRSDLFETILNKPVTAENLFTRVTRALCASAASGCCDRGSDDPDASEESFSKEVDLTIRILVVDDVRVNLKVAQRMCERLGYQSVDAVTNGKEALIAVAENEYDVILMDVQMPEMDGLQATKCICSQFPSDKRPVIIGMTANAMLEDREECYAVGMSDYISKPVQSKMLAAALARIRRRR